MEVAEVEAANRAWKEYLHGAGRSEDLDAGSLCEEQKHEGCPGGFQLRVCHTAVVAGPMMAKVEEEVLQTKVIPLWTTLSGKSMRI